jgi:hypothetical protein
MQERLPDRRTAIRARRRRAASVLIAALVIAGLYVQRNSSGAVGRRAAASRDAGHEGFAGTLVQFI